MTIEYINTTPTFPPEIRPVKRGVYITRNIDPETGVCENNRWMYSFYDNTDKIWGCGALTPEQATSHPDFEFAEQNKEWRGLAEEPKS